MYEKLIVDFSKKNSKKWEQKMKNKRMPRLENRQLLKIQIQTNGEKLEQQQ